MSLDKKHITITSMHNNIKKNGIKLCNRNYDQNRNYYDNPNHPNYQNNNNNIQLCSNCGSKCHEYRDCQDPITSWGIILINLDGLPKPSHENKINLMKNKITQKNKILSGSVPNSK